MNALLICPPEQRVLSCLAGSKPLATVPLLGQSLLEYWLAHLARQGASRVLILTTDRPPDIEALVADGSRWGISVQVKSEAIELTPAEALLKYATELDPGSDKTVVTLLDHFPGQPEHRLFRGADEFLNSLMAWMPQAFTPDRVGFHEIQPGVWAGTRSSISPEAKVQPPCWLGQHVMVGAGALIGPRTILEDGVFIESMAEVSDSWIGEETLVGELTRVQNALAWGSTLVDCSTGTTTIVPDRFVLCPLSHPPQWRQTGWFSRLAERYLRNKDGTALLWKELIPQKEAKT